MFQSFLLRCCYFYKIFSFLYISPLSHCLCYLQYFERSRFFTFTGLSLFTLRALYFFSQNFYSSAIISIVPQNSQKKRICDYIDFVNTMAIKKKEDSWIECLIECYYSIVSVKKRTLFKRFCRLIGARINYLEIIERPSDSKSLFHTNVANNTC